MKRGFDLKCFENSLKEILCCPDCKSDLQIEDDNKLLCCKCGNGFDINDGIIVLMPQNGNQAQNEERELREKVAEEHGSQDIEKIYKAIEKHHCMPLMSSKAEAFRNQFNNNQWIVDVGCGSGYYWQKSDSGAKLILMDFAMSNLKAARNILKDSNNVLFVQADASCLPFKNNAVSGIWSVQVTQHFPETVMTNFLNELQRVLQIKHVIEIYNLNPDFMHKVIYRLFGKYFHIKGQYGEMLQNKLHGKELLFLWEMFTRDGKTKIEYSELFFHPNFKLFPQFNAIVYIEKILNLMPFFTKLFARQISINISKM
ncbi:MAG: hypothetical protein A2Y03_04925 [Omnitrophica WOR_2 bacterium GWF2_38_59]|nr:MAG: hypothetical protein A2Y03_04925 [Omnitrophica WOR_2 bacterium GWF2_38_59]OGX48273.1 MAG: hypothetical protein A2243_10365 [Omnitrophica WOR_2 bacterium RIFOXYA2_FULL_38_17]OGX54870.1 MAG: hypothetical protein A2267_01255 [Omnitrophica WOR_2 bacterium RIFOXYA12_FULL_38_10]OGX59563.1 MAG: hypothetical protein A2447_11935 [Omnitrophica WOR_2 bacterium RIFOXYC2_FULL_38_12]OGX59954.1 MAG: hypothetical protein A2306_04470 [Omnitrophica WOR_2 bacterium RIFOXYB2_FULL_38_16]